MKKILYIMNVLLITLFAACSEETQDIESGKYEVTVDAAVDYAMAGDDAMTATEPNTRAAADVDRYVIEVYTDAACTQAANVFTGGTNKTTNTTGSFTMTLDNAQPYYCLLWADCKASDVYDVSDLKAVSLKAGVSPTEAFHGKSTISKAQSTYSVTLNRAVANVVLKETGTLPAGELVMKFSRKTSFDVSTATTTGTATDRTDRFMIDQPITGTEATPAIINTGAIFVLAPAAAAEKMDIVFKYATKAEFTVADIQIQANFNTNITGHYEGAITPSHIYDNDTKAVAPKGEGTETAPYLLASAANIKWLQELTEKQGTTNGKYFKLMTDIEVVSNTWTPIAADTQGNPYNQFNGYFNGNGHQFTGKLVAAADWGEYYFGIFTRLGTNAEVSNLTNAAEVVAPNVANVGGIAGLSYGKLTRCKNTAKITAKYDVGGIVGYGYYAYNEMTTGTEIVVSDCENSGEIIALERENDYGVWCSSVGGIIGCGYFQPASGVSDNNQVFFILENCTNTGSVSAPADSKYAGGIIGRPMVVRGTCQIKNCTNSGTIKSGEVTATENMGGDNKLGLLVGGQYTGYTGVTVIE